MDRLKFLAFVLLLVVCSLFFYHLGVSSGYRAAAAGHLDPADVAEREAQMEELARRMLVQMQSTPFDDPSGPGPADACPGAEPPAAGSTSPVRVVGPALAPIGAATPPCPVKP